MQPFVEMENFHENVQIKISYDAIQHGLSVCWDLLERVLVFIFSSFSIVPDSEVFF